MLDVEDQLWGERYGSIRDPFGHNWSLGTPLRATTPEAVVTAMTDAAPVA